MSDARREGLVEAQAALARALLDASAPTPAGFDAAALADARALVVSKHRHDATRRAQRMGDVTEQPLRALGRAIVSAPRPTVWWRKLLGGVRRSTPP